MGEDLNGRLCGQPRKLVTSAFSAKSFPCSALPIVAGSSTVKLLLRFRPRVFRGIRGRQNDDERPPVRVPGPMRSRHRIMPCSKHQVERIKVIARSNFMSHPVFCRTQKCNRNWNRRGFNRNRQLHLLSQDKDWWSLKEIIIAVYRNYTTDRDKVSHWEIFSRYRVQEKRIRSLFLYFRL